MNLSFLDTLADLASREVDGESSSFSSRTDSMGSGSTTSESCVESGPAPKRLRAYSESFVRDKEDSKFDWEATKQRLLQLSANTLLYTEQDGEGAGATVKPDPASSTQQHQERWLGPGGQRARSDSELEEDRRDNGLGESVATTSMLERYDQLYNKGGRIGVYTREERLAIIRRFHDKRKQRVWKKKIRYHCRKNLADRRLRVKGRFIKAGSEAYFALQAQGVIDAQGQLVLQSIDEGEDDDEEDGAGDEDADGASGGSGSPPPSAPDAGRAAAAAAAAAAKKEQQLLLREAALKEKQEKLVAAQRQKQQAAAKKQQQAAAKAQRPRSNSGSAPALESPGDSSAIFDDMVRSPTSEHAARNSLSLLLSMADGGGGSPVRPTATGSAAADCAIPPFLLEARAAGVSTGTSAGAAPNPNGLGLYLLGRAISTENLERASNGSVSPVRPSAGVVAAGADAGAGAGAGAGVAAGALSLPPRPPSDAELVDLLLSSKRMRRHSIAY